MTTNAVFQEKQLSYLQDVKRGDGELLDRKWNNSWNILMPSEYHLAPLFLVLYDSNLFWVKMLQWNILSLLL